MTTPCPRCNGKKRLGGEFSNNFYDGPTCSGTGRIQPEPSGEVELDMVLSIMESGKELARMYDKYDGDEDWIEFVQKRYMSQAEPFATLKHQLKDELLREVGEDEPYKKLEHCPYCGERQYSCYCIDRTNAERDRFRAAIERVMGNG